MRRSGTGGLRDERQPEVEVEDVGVRRERANAANCSRAARGRRADRATVGLGMELLAVEDDEPGVDPFRRSACTFSHGIPAMLTGQCVTEAAVGHVQRDTA